MAVPRHYTRSLKPLTSLYYPRATHVVDEARNRASREKVYRYLLRVFRYVSEWIRTFMHYQTPEKAQNDLKQKNYATNELLYLQDEKPTRIDFWGSSRAPKDQGRCEFLFPFVVGLAQKSSVVFNFFWLYLFWNDACVIQQIDNRWLSYHLTYSLFLSRLLLYYLFAVNDEQYWHSSYFY